VARRKRKKPGLLANRPNRRLSPVQKELIAQTHASCGSINATCRELGVSYETVRKVLREAEEDLNLQRARRRAVDELAGKASAQAERLLGSITDEELQSATLPTYHPNGAFKSLQELGPGLAGKARAFGIFADKVALLQQARSATLPGSSDPSRTGDAGLLLPNNVDDAKRMIAQKVRRLRIVDLQFSEGETGQRIDYLADRANLREQDIEDADYSPFGTGPDPFD